MLCFIWQIAKLILRLIIFNRLRDVAVALLLILNDSLPFFLLRFYIERREKLSKSFSDSELVIVVVLLSTSFMKIAI